MNSIKHLITEISNGNFDNRINEVYVDSTLTEYHRTRYVAALEKFIELFGEKEVEIYSAPGRSEVCGNHTDHQHGHVLATSINLDAIAVVAPTDDNKVRLVSGDFPMIEMDLNDVDKREEELETTDALIRGVADGLKKKGCKIGGFETYITSDVLMGAGMSSSAAFESLIGTIISGLYNDGKVSSVDIAKIGQYAENVYFGKPCGLMDQMACSVGGLIYIDFADKENPVIEQVPCDFEAHKYSLCIVDTKGSHADLTDDYAAIPVEMKKVAQFFGKEVCAEITEEQVISNLAAVREACGDRAVLRALHFFEENKRVEAEIKALKENNFADFLAGITESGNSSWKWLQNCFTNHSYQEQGITVALALTELFLKEKRCGACRVHGGGFAGVIMAMMPEELVEEYVAYIESALGEGNAYRMSIRPYGAVCLNTL